jgi:uncharacterized protein YjbJ (UPF0337 family)
MALDDDIKNGVQNLTGKAKEAVGKVTDDPKLQAEGKADQIAAKAKGVAADAKDKLTGR